MKVESTSADRGIKHISLSVLFTYFTVFVFHPAFMLLGLASLTPGRALAAQSSAIYENLKGKYQLDTPDNDVSRQDEVMNIRQTYGKGSGGAASVIESLSKYQGQSHVADNVNLSAYPKGNFSQNYQDSYNQAASGGNGIGNLTMPGVSGNNASVRYAPNGGVKLERDANGNIISTVTGGVVNNTISSVVGAEASNGETSFAAKNTYSPHDEDGLIDVVKGRINAAQVGGNTSDSVAYRTIMESYQLNKPQNISRDDPVFLGAKGAVNDALTQKGLFEGSCQSLTTTTTKSISRGARAK